MLRERSIHRDSLRVESSGIAEIRYEGITKKFGEVIALDELSLTVPAGAFLALLGPSGCGKTTALRILAGLDSPTGGRVFIGEHDVTELEPRTRDVAMVFQNYALYPHMDVARNIGYPLRIRGHREDFIAERTKATARLLAIENLLDRRPRELSGGQRQRVALARAIVREPRAFLMDEPLSNLDARLRMQMRGEIKHLQKTLGTTTVFVTHDQAEALTMADLIAVIDGGRLQQVGNPDQIYNQPANRFVASFVGSPGMNILSCTLDRSRHCLIGMDWTHELGPLADRLAEEVSAPEVELGVRPEAAMLLSDSRPDTIPAEVYAVEPMGNETVIELRVGDAPFTVRTPLEFTASIGSRCWLDLRHGRRYFFEQASGRLAFHDGGPTRTGYALDSVSS